MKARAKQMFFLGLSGFPLGMAAIQRQKLISKALISEGWNVVVICSRGTHNKELNIKKVGRYKGVLYVYLFGPFRNQNFIIRNLQKVIAPFMEFALLLRFKRRRGIHAAIVSNRNSFLASIKYRVVSKVLDFKLIINLVEIYKRRENTNIPTKINDLLFNNLGVYFYDAVFPISRYIRDSYSLHKKKHHLIPIITDYSYINSVSIGHKLDKPFFLFCGSASYYSSISFVIEAFSLIDIEDCNLILVTNGSSNEMFLIDDLITKKHLNNKVIIMKSITDRDLFSLYKSANGLLLPMFDTIQDQARFPHKLAEYLASGTSVISNPIGEVGFFLKHLDNALLSESGNVNRFADNMKWILNNQTDAKIIGSNGAKLCKLNFDIKIMSKSIDNFLNNLIQSD